MLLSEFSIGNFYEHLVTFATSICYLLGDWDHRMCSQRSLGRYLVFPRIYTVGDLLVSLFYCDIPLVSYIFLGDEQMKKPIIIKLQHIQIVSVVVAAIGFLGVIFSPGNLYWVMLFVTGLVGYFHFGKGGMF